MGCSESNVKHKDDKPEDKKLSKSDNTAITTSNKTIPRLEQVKGSKSRLKKSLKQMNDKKWTNILSFLTYNEMYIAGQVNHKINRVASSFLSRKKTYEEELERKKILESRNNTSKKKSLMSTKRMSILDVLQQNYEKKSSTALLNENNEDGGVMNKESTMSSPETIKIAHKEHGIQS